VVAKNTLNADRRKKKTKKELMKPKKRKR